MTPDQLTAFVNAGSALVPIIVPIGAALTALFIPSPGPVVVRWSSAWWSKMIRGVAGIWQMKATQTAVAMEISPAMQAAINQAVTATVSALSRPASAPVPAITPLVPATTTPSNVWLTGLVTPGPAGPDLSRPGTGISPTTVAAPTT